MSGLTIVAPHRPSSASPILGIDLGTTFSLAAVMEQGTPRMIRDASGDARVPSVLSFDPAGKVTVGQDAKKHLLVDPHHTVYSVKRLIGRTLGDLQADLAFVPYQIIERVETSGRKVLHVVIDGREHTPEELSAMILRSVVSRASAELGVPIEKAVVTVPAYFDESQRQATRDAGRIAGLDVIRIVNEPTAAALAYGLAERKEGIVAVYDFGGGTFDCSILDIAHGVFKVLSTHGDTHLGGDDIDLTLVRFFESGTLAGKTSAPEDRAALRDGCERLKIALTSSAEAEVEISLSNSPSPFVLRLSRAKFDELIAPLVDRTLASCRSALRDASVSAKQVDEVILVGGSSRIPLVRQRVEQLFERPPHHELNPDEVVAMGAAVQASILAGESRRLLLLDITPLSLGIETMGGAVSRLIARNSTIPAQATEHFTTFVDNQTGVNIHVVQGERELATDCRSLGKFTLAGLPPMPAGMPRIEVTFLIDANGMLQVSAREERSGRSARIEVQPSQGLSREQVETMILESVSRARDDFQARRLIELRNKAEANIMATDKGLRSAGDQLPADLMEQITVTRSNLEIARSATDVEALQKALDAFDAATLPLAELMMNSVLKAEVVGKNLSDV